MKTKVLRLFPLEIQHWTAQELDFFNHRETFATREILHLLTDEENQAIP